MEHMDYMNHMNHMEDGGGHSGHSMPMPNCTMSMIWNTDTTGMCIVHPAWHVGTSQAFVGSLIVVFALAVLYEYGKWAVRCVDVAIMQSRAAPGRRGGRRGLMLEEDEDVSNTSGLRRNRPSSSRRGAPGDTVLTIDAREEAGEPSSSRLSPTSLIAALPQSLRTPARLKGVRAVVYGANVALSVFLMLVMMTYNAWLISAIVLGAVAGSFLFDPATDGSALADKGTVCH